MLGIGRQRVRITIQNPVELLDAMGAPYASAWTNYLVAASSIENDTINGDEDSAAPQANNFQSATFSIRYHPQLEFNVRQRIVLDDGTVFAVRAIRFNQDRSWAYLDGVSGSSGGQP